MKLELAKLVPILRELKRSEKLFVVQVLVSELAQEESSQLLQQDVAYPIWSPYDAFDAAETMIKALNESKAKDYDAR